MSTGGFDAYGSRRRLADADATCGVEGFRLKEVSR